MFALSTAVNSSFPRMYGTSTGPTRPTLTIVIIDIEGTDVHSPNVPPTTKPVPSMSPILQSTHFPGPFYAAQMPQVPQTPVPSVPQVPGYQYQESPLSEFSAGFFSGFFHAMFQHFASSRHDQSHDSDSGDD